MRTVGVEFDEPVVVAFHSPGEPGSIRGAKARLACAVKHVNSRVYKSEVDGECARTVWRVVVDHQHVGFRNADKKSADHSGEIVALVVGGNDDE